MTAPFTSSLKFLVPIEQAGRLDAGPEGDRSLAGCFKDEGAGAEEVFGIFLAALGIDGVRVRVPPVAALLELAGVGLNVNAVVAFLHANLPWAGSHGEIGVGGGAQGVEISQAGEGQ